MSCKRSPYHSPRRRMDSERQGGPYRARDGKIFGVCKGLADHLDFSVVWLRIITIGLMFVTGFWPVVITYFVAALVMKLEPVVPLESPGEQEFYNSYSVSRSMAIQRLKRTFDSLDRRIQRIEDIVTARDYEWDERLHRNL